MGAGTVVFFVVGVIALVGGAEGLVRGASDLATRFGLSSVVIGLTVVAFGTSAPELAVSIGAALRDEIDIAIGNVVGSNIANVLLVLGLAAVVGGGLTVAQRIVRIDVPIMIGVSVLVFVLALDGELGRLEGALLVALLIGYVTWTVRSARREQAPAIEAEYEEAIEVEEFAATGLATELGLIAAGLVGLVIGSQLLVSAATDVAEAIGVSELVIGLTVVAVGTSLPEIATSVLAAARGERDIAVGNAVGSNIFNLLAVLGITAAVSPSPLPVADGALNVDLPVMLAAAIACLPMFANGYELKRWEGAVFVTLYAAYVGWLVLDANDHPARDGYVWTMLYVVVPTTVLALTVAAYRAVRQPSPP
ncbi:MAG: calcium/sodium antiporter [Ilumatobacteraceae bacterium]|nr:calcium/sodium antiporter [Ilumatobacteraceae bacterium]